MIDLSAETAAPDGVAWFRDRDEQPTIASLSDVHGFLDAVRSALTAVGETDRPPLVTADDDGRLHWADEDYLLILNGDLIDRGPDNDACVALLERLAREAPPGRVRYHLGNHEMAVLLPDAFGWSGPYSVELDDAARRAFTEAVADGHVPVAFEGYGHTYSHAGSNDPIDVAAVNETARSAARELLEDPAATASMEAQRRVIDDHASVFGLGGPTGRGADAGLLWMDFRHMDADAPPQVVGHSRHTAPRRKGQVICENVIRENRDSPGGEAVVLETPDGIEAVVRERDGARTMDL